MTAEPGTGKTVSLEVLAARTAQARAAGRKVVHCHGVFDLLHIGHIRYLEGARRLGDMLVVTITPDHFVGKGPERPAFTAALRAEALAALACVDMVAVNRWPTAVEVIGLLRSHYYVKGAEYRDAANDPTGKIVDEAEAARAAGTEVRFIDDIVFSSSNLINRFLPAHPPEVRDWLAEFRTRVGAKAVLEWMERAENLRVLCLGEAIIDEYHFCDTLGKSGKEPILAARFVSAERFAGGILAIANHAAGLSRRVEMLTALGEYDTHEDFIRGKLHPAVTPRFLTQPDAPTIVKRRFVELYPPQKLFEVYVMNDCEETEAMGRALRAAVAERLPEVDCVVVADYGHGLLDPQTIEFLCEKAPYLAVNVQVNAGNIGFNTISKYRRADFVCISEKELRLDARSRARPLERLMEDAAGRLGCGRLCITQGKQGCLAWGAGQGVFRAPALTGSIVDRIGAGDAVLAYAAQLAAAGAPAEIVGFVGNAAGAQAVTTLGNKEPVDGVALKKHIVALLK
jgi:rfaE bifunctional protein nucleotidyltransferase chain/domain